MPTTTELDEKGNQRSSAPPSSSTAGSCWRPCARFGRGEFDTRLPDGLDGVDGQICESFNDLAQFAEVAARRGGRAAPAGGARGPHPPPAGSQRAPGAAGRTTSTGSTRCSTTSPPTRPRSPGWSPRWPRATSAQAIDVDGKDVALRGRLPPPRPLGQRHGQPAGGVRQRGDPRRPGGRRRGQARRPGARARRLRRLEGADRQREPDGVEPHRPGARDRPGDHRGRPGRPDQDGQHRRQGRDPRAQEHHQHDGRAAGQLRRRGDAASPARWAPRGGSAARRRCAASPACGASSPRT